MFRKIIKTVKIKLKQLAPFLMLAIFVVNITGVLFLWHIAAEGCCENHDCDHCPICQNTFINSAKIINTSSATTFTINVSERKIEYVYDSPLTLLIIPNLIPRAPPI